MKEDHYVFNKGKYQPINVIPSGEIKCTTCQRYFSSETIQEHLSTHIKPKFLLPSTHGNKVHKIMAPKFVDSYTTDDSDIDVQSMSPNELPVTQQQRKFIAPPSGQQAQESEKASKYSNFFDPNIKTFQDSQDLTSNLGIRRRGKNPEEFQILNIEDKFDIPTKSSKVSKKNIHLYKNQRLGGQLMDETTSKKKHHLTQNLEPLEYLVRDDSKILTESTITQKTGRKIPCNFKRVPGSSTLFNTQSNNLKHTYVHDDRSDESEVRPYKIQESSQKPLKTVTNIGGCDNKCPCCGGFYCSYCKSTIPPKYRPVHQVSPEEQEQIRQFYRAYNKKPCKNCQCKD